MIHVAIVSHGHESLLITSKMGGLQIAGENLRVWVKDNKPSPALSSYCEQHGICYSDAEPGMGFGDNNNFIYRLIQQRIGFKPGDTFVVMNPDITIDPQAIASLAEQMHRDRYPIATINLYRDQQFAVADSNIRRFPDIFSLIRMTIVRSLSQPYDKTGMDMACHVDWASGAFLAFDAMHYSALEGFDPRYFMYFEDVDICYRSQKLLGNGVRYYPALRAIHTAAHKNRNLISQHASWFFQSFLKFLSRRYFIYDRRENLTSAKKVV
jgi:N-acetylglucosaminyl-diphospho-decaprenol L-rhamnosyltransferase